MSFPLWDGEGLWRQFCLVLHFSDGVTKALRGPSYSYAVSQTWNGGLSQDPASLTLPPSSLSSLPLILSDL